MEVVVSAEAKMFVNGHGGVVYVRSRLHRCGGGPLTLLDITTEHPSDVDDYVAIDNGEIAVNYHGDPIDRPHVLSIEVDGIVLRHLSAYRDGCIYKP